MADVSFSTDGVQEVLSKVEKYYNEIKSIISA